MVEEDEPLLVTCTLRDAIVDRRDLVVELLEARPAGAETVFAACENSPHEVYEEIEKICKANGIVSLKTVVNRMCREEEKRDDTNRRVILAHPLGELVFEQPPRSLALLEALGRLEEVEVVEEFDARKDRKIWMVNGVHLALALMARAAPQGEPAGFDLARAAMRPEVLVQLAQLHGPMDEALRRKHPGLTENLKYGRDHVLAYMEHPDYVARVLSGFKRQDLAPFIGTMEERIGAPARVCFQANCSREAFEPVLDVFEDLVKDPDAFVDAADIRADPSLVDEGADRRALEAYERFLTGWMPVAIVEARVARLALALEASSPL
ncbi:MAG TPA: hypothetical protein VNC16_01815 [Solirubrobacterales bacterium]|nr:hypothetical protein [Solirubrobacterales bacterium]